MTIRELEIFIEVVNTKSMSEAAAKLNISQPTVSHAISEIENQYNIKLFERISKKIYITDTGISLYNYGLKLLDLYSEIDVFLQHSSQNYTINIGTSITFGTLFLAEVVKEFEQKNKNISIKVYIDNSSVILDKVKKGLLDIGLIEGEIAVDNVISENFFTDELSIICSKKHKFAKRPFIDLKHLKNENFALREENNMTRKIFTKLLSQNDVPINIKWICNNNDSILNIVESDSAISIVSERFLNRENIVKVPIRDFDFQRSLKIIYNKEKYISCDILSLIEEMQNIFSTSIGE